MRAPALLLGLLLLAPFALGGSCFRMECNGSAALCDRRYDEISFPTSHNAFSDWATFGIYFNHWDDMHTQLVDGIRGLMLDTWYWDVDGDGYDDSALCHSWCGAGSRLLVDALSEIRAFLDSHPRDVITIIFESYITAADTALAFEASGLIDYVYTHDPQQAWPTLRQMIHSGQRLVVLTDDGSSGPPWHHYVWSLAFETHFSNWTVDDFSCDDNRGTPGAPGTDLFILNHFLTRNGAVPTQAAVVNANPFFVDRAVQCWQESGYVPNFPTVDFATTGDVVGTAAMLNQLWTQTGGLPPP